MNQTYKEFYEIVKEECKELKYDELLELIAILTAKEIAFKQAYTGKEGDRDVYIGTLMYTTKGAKNLQKTNDILRRALTVFYENTKKEFAPKGKA